MEIAGSTTKGIKNKKANTERIAVVPIKYVFGYKLQYLLLIFASFNGSNTYLNITTCKIWPSRGTRRLFPLWWGVPRSHLTCVMPASFANFGSYGSFASGGNVGSSDFLN